MLADSIYDNGLDAGLKALADLGNVDLHICSAEPATYTEAVSTYDLGLKAAVTITGPTAGDASGRKVTVSAVTGGIVTQDGTAAFFALVNPSNSELLVTAPITVPQQVYSGNSFALEAWDVEFPLPSTFTVTSGPSYWLPDSVTQTAYSGIGGGGLLETEASMMDYGIPFRMWSWYCGSSSSGVGGNADGTPDFTQFENNVAYHASYGRTIEVRLFNGGGWFDYQTPMFGIPADYHQYLTAYEYDAVPASGPRWQANVWHPTVAARFRDLVAAFGAEYADDPRIESVLIQGMSYSSGEEWDFGDVDIQGMADLWYGGDRVALLNALETWITDLMDAYAAAFAGYEHKVVWVGVRSENFEVWVPNAYPSDGWQEMNQRLSEYAQTLGFGQRRGIQTKNFWVNFEIPDWGLSIDSDGYQYVDETLPIFDGRYRGEESEKIFQTTYTDDPEFWRMTVFRGLQLRLNHVYSRYDLYNDFGSDIWEYMRLGLGKTVATSADAFALLWEDDINPNAYYGNITKLRNFERWLVQRDVPGGITVPTEFHDSPISEGYRGWEEGPPWGWYTARRTNIASGQDRMFFAADSAFAIDRALKVFVEVVDDTNEWCIEYTDTSGGSAQTNSYTGTGDSAIRTVEFNITGIQAGGLSNSMDFSIRWLSGNDVIVRLVRLVAV